MLWCCHLVITENFMQLVFPIPGIMDYDPEFRAEIELNRNLITSSFACTQRCHRI